MQKLAVASLSGAAAVVVLLLALAVGGGARDAVAGISDASPGVTQGLAIFRLLSEVLAVGTVGLLLGALLRYRQGKDEISSTSTRRWLRAASTLASYWMLASILQLIFAYADFAALPLARALDINDLLGFVDAVSQAKALAVQALLASICAALCFRVKSAYGAVGVLLLALVAVLPPPLTGHSAAAGNHSLGTSTLALHVGAATVWFGGVFSLVLLAFGKAETASLEIAAKRFSKIALWCFVSIGITGVVNASLRIRSPSDLFDNGYGNLVLIKVLALIGIGIIGYRYRQSILVQLESAQRTAFRKLIAIEAAIMLSTFAIAVALSRSQPPYDPDSAAVSPTRLILGYDLPDAPNIWRLLTQWQLDGYVVIAAAFAIALYVTAMRRLKARGRSWSRYRTGSWIGGWLLAVAITSSGVGTYSSATFSVHMAQHMFLNMLIPIFLVLGEPIRLALQSLPRSPKGQRGPREALTIALRSRIAHFMTNGIVAAGIFVLSLWLLYFTSLFETAMGSHWGHVLMQFHFLAAGFLFYYCLIGQDVSARRFPYPARLALLGLTMISHAFFGLALMSKSDVIAESYYLSLQRPWAQDLLYDQKVGAGFAWAFGELPITIILIVLFAKWVQSETRASNEETEAVHGSIPHASETVVDQPTTDKR